MLKCKINAPVPLSAASTTLTIAGWPHPAAYSLAWSTLGARFRLAQAQVSKGKIVVSISLTAAASTTLAIAA